MLEVPVIALDDVPDEIPGVPCAGARKAWIPSAKIGILQGLLER
jgi:hypothetical protein